MTHPVRDEPQVLRVLFHPRRDYTAAPDTTGVEPVSVEVEPGIAVGGRLYRAGPEAPAILYWHGNGEIAANYDGIAPLYTRLGITLLVVDYRGYGTSDGTPTGTNLLADAVTVFHAVDRLFKDHGLDPSRLYVMGRSIGTAAAIEVSAHGDEHPAGLIVESGFANTFSLLARLALRVEGADEARDGFGNRDKIRLVTIPTLLIHGKDDVLIPATEGEELYCACGAKDKRLVLIPGAGHNDLMMVGMERYFEAIRQFVLDEAGG